ncbi:MAG: HAMP domain-containing histidine kinase [Bacteroidota bacterium]|nr:HAMP domain-containing histidine kinase [Bacteroidota bacterium]
MMVNRRTGIKLKITLAFSLVFILLSFSLNIYSYQRIRQMIISDNNKYLLSRANTLLDKTEVNPVIIPLPDKNTSIRVLDHSGSKKHTVFQSPGVIGSIKTPAKAGVTDTLNMRVAYVISGSDDNPAELMLAVSNEPLSQSLSFLFQLLFISSIISVIVAGLISYLMAGFLLLPIQRIIDAANKITTNKLRDTIPVKNTNDELQELTETINSMLIRIDESLQQQQNFFASASHELKTPLAILKAELEVQLKNPGLSPEIMPLLHSQMDEINRLQEVVQEFLIISQLKSVGLSIHLEQFDLSSLILKSFNRLMPLFRQNGLTPDIKFDQESADYFIIADEDKIRMVLVNLLENVCKYSIGNSIVSCKVKQSSDTNYISVNIINDISAENIPTEKLLEAFYRGDGLQKGAGLGLWLCNEIIKSHGGEMHIQSSSYRFEVSFTLPLKGIAKML